MLIPRSKLPNQDNASLFSSDKRYQLHACLETLYQAGNETKENDKKEIQNGDETVFTCQSL